MKYASGGEGAEKLPSLSHKLDFLFTNNFAPMAVKNKSKTLEEEKAFKVADKLFDEYSEQLN